MQTQKEQKIETQKSTQSFLVTVKERSLLKQKYLEISVNGEVCEYYALSVVFGEAKLRKIPHQKL